MSGILNVMLADNAAAAAAATTWDSLAKNANLSLSNGNLTVAATSTSTDQSLRATVSAATGKKYLELHADTISAPAFYREGIANSTHSVNAALGSDNDSVGWSGGSGDVTLQAVTLSTVATWAQGDTLCFAYDIDAQLIWFRVNGGNWNNSGAANPATGAGGI